MKKRGGFLKSLGLFILCLTAPITLICAPLIIANFRKTKTVKPNFRVQNECVQYTQNKGKTWDTVITLSELMEKCGITGATGIKSVTEVPERTDATKTTYKITFHDNTVFEFEVKNGEDGEKGENGKDGRGIKSIQQDTTNSTAEKSVYIITFDDNSKYSFEVLNGTNGTDGTNGSTISIGDNGNWFIDDKDTGKPATGSKGDTGKAGQSSYIYIKYANVKPTTLNDILEEGTGSWMGIYAGTKLENDLYVSDYNWYNIKGEDGKDGEDGQDGQDGKDGKDGKDGQDGKDGKDGQDGKDGTDADVDRYTVTYDYGITDEYFQVDSVSGELKKSEQIKSTQWITSLPEIKEEYANRFEGWFIQGTNKQIEKYDFVGGDVTLEARLIPGLYYYSRFTPWDKLAIEVNENSKTISDCDTSLHGELIIDKDITTIGNKAFQYCRDLTKVILTKNVTTIGNLAFADCDSLEEIKLPRGVKNIYYASFSNCPSLERIVVEQGNNTLDSRENCNAIIDTYSNSLLVGCKNTIIPNDVESIDGYAFSRCSGLTEITIPNSVTYIGEYAFSECANLTKADLSNNNISSIYSYTFYGCSSLTELNIPSSVTEIYEYAFLGCTGLETINVDPENRRYDSRNNCNAIIDNSWNTELIYGCKTTVIPEDVNVIGKSAFRDCTTLTEITIPENIAAICEEAFYGCAGLTEITIPRNVELIEDYAFDYCENLKTVTIDSAFIAEDFDDWWECGGLLTNSSIVMVYVAEHCDVVGSAILIGHFYKLTETDMPNYTKHVIESGLYQNGVQVKTWDELITDGTITLSEDQTTITACDTSIDGDLIMSDTVKIIAENSFIGCGDLDSLNISESVESIAKGAFIGCASLRSVAVSQSNYEYHSRMLCILVESHTNTLMLCCCVDGDKLDLYNITTIAVGAFAGNMFLHTIEIPNSVKVIEANAFNSCGNLSEITFETPISSTDGLTTIGEYAFAYCSGLDEIEITKRVTEIGNSAFEGCYIDYVTIDSPTIANSLTGKDLNTYGGLLACAETVAIRLGLDVSGSTYLASAYKLERSSYRYDIYILKK